MAVLQCGQYSGILPCYRCIIIYARAETAAAYHSAGSENETKDNYSRAKMCLYIMSVPIIDPHMHMISRNTNDYDRARLAGVECCIEPAFWSGQDKQHAESFFDYFEKIIDFETKRADRTAGVDHYVTIGLEPKEANYPEMAERVMDRVPEYLDRDNVVGVGEIGLDQGTEEEEYAFRRQPVWLRSVSPRHGTYAPHEQARGNRAYRRDDP